MFSSHIFILKYYLRILEICALRSLDFEHTHAATLLITQPVHFCNRYFDLLILSPPPLLYRGRVRDQDHHRRREMSKDLEQPLNPVSDDIVIAKPALSAGAAEAAERRGLIVSMVTLVISIPALIGA
jgi:hypothetical protein